MFYDATSNQHGLPRDPFKAIVSPRPIGWIGTRSAAGADNIAPYSFFNAISDDPKIVMFSSGGLKDSVRNIQETGVFTTSFVGRELAEAMNATSVAAPHGISEFGLAGLEPADGVLVPAPYVALAHAVLECRMTQILQPVTLEGTVGEDIVVFGQVVGIHIADAVIRNGRFDVSLARPVGRLGYFDYCDAGDTFEMHRPKR